MDRRLIVALDVPTVADARTLVAQLDGLVGFYKVGMWLFFEPGVDAFIDDLVGAGHRVFLDYKMYDIPETVRQGVASAAGRGVDIVTVHGDPAILAAAAEGAGGTPLSVYAITVLTSQDDAALRAMGYDRPVQELVALRADAAVAAGVPGLIAAATDLPALRRHAGALRFATPGIRLPGEPTHDQARTATPAQALAAGAHHLVVGRPITAHADPAARARLILADMAAA